MTAETRFPKIIKLQTINLLLLVVLASNLFGGAADLSSVNFKQAGKFITALERDERGRVWIGTEDEGVLVCDPAGDGKLRQFTAADGLGDNNAYALACDGRGRIWAGNLRHGVSVYNGEKWRNYDVNAGPLGERVFAIETSPVDGDVWIASSVGLARYCSDGS